MNERNILHLDMDAFFASIEQAVNPKLRGKPLIVGGRADRKRTVVCAASYEAKKFGVDSGISCREAFRLCPQAEFVVADSTKYLYVSGEIFKILQNYSPQVEQASVDEFYLDVSGCDKIFGSYLGLALKIKNTIRNRFHITGSIGISVNRLMSKIASKLKKPDGLVILEKEDISRTLANLPVEKIPGIGRSLTKYLNDVSISSFSDLEKASNRFLYKKFGKLGLWMYTATHPEASEEAQINWICQEESLPKSVGHSYTLPKNIFNRFEIEAWFRLLSEMVGFRLRRYNLESRTMHIYLRKPNLEFISKEKNFRDDTNDSSDLYKRALFILDSLKVANTLIRALGLNARNLAPAMDKCLFAFQQKRINMFKAQDRINERFGDWTIYPASISSIK